jgi:hypothetical protein
VHRSSGDVADEEVREALLPRAGADENAAEPVPEEDDARDLESPCPATAPDALRVERLPQDERIRVGVEVEARKEEDDVEQAVLDCHEELRETVEV